jgi:hypothetical protein
MHDCQLPYTRSTRTTTLPHTTYRTLREGTRMWGTQLVSLLAILLALPGNEALAVRPFVTDDARIIYKDQLEVESWADVTFQRGQKPGFGISSLQGYAPTDRLEIIAGGFGLQYHDRKITVENLVFQPKYLILRSLDSWIPSISAAAALLAPLSGNRQQWNSYAMLHASWFLFTPQDSTDPYDNGLAIHINAGTKSQYDAGLGGRYTSKPFWGVAFEVATPINRKLRVVGEIFNGDPFFYEDEFPAFQAGFRWYQNEDVQFDFVFGGQRISAEQNDGRRAWDHTIQVGYRQMFDFGS